MAHADPLAQVVPQNKIAIFRDFTNFFHNYYIATQVVDINWIS